MYITNMSLKCYSFYILSITQFVVFILIIRSILYNLRQKKINLKIVYTKIFGLLLFGYSLLCSIHLIEGFIQVEPINRTPQQEAELAAMEAAVSKKISAKKQNYPPLSVEQITKELRTSER